MVDVADTVQAVKQVGILGTGLTLNGLPSWGVFIVLITAFVRGWLPWRKEDNARDASLRADLMRLLAEGKREHAEEIAAIRKEQAEERIAHAESLNAIRAEQAQERKACDDNLRGLQAQLDGLMRQIITMQLATGKPIAFPPATDEAATRLLEQIKDAPGKG